MRLVWKESSASGVGAARAHALFCVLSAVLLASVLVPPFRAAPVACLVHLLLGVAGPGCGMTRAFLFIGHGDLAAAFALNPNSLLVFAVVVALWVNAGARLLCGHEAVVLLSRPWKLGIYLTMAALTAVAWIYNLTANPWT